MLNQSPVNAQIEGHVGILTFNRPRLMNAFNSELIDASNKAMSEFVSNETVMAIIVRGNGKCFSAGFDMKESAAREIKGEDQWREILTKDFDFIMQFWNSPKPTIAAAHGYCIGGAMEILMACDLAVASKNTLFGEPEVRFGSGIVAMLAPYVVGPKHAKEFLLTGNDRITAQRCYEMGILNRIVADGYEMNAAMEFAKQIASAAPHSLRMTKAAIHRSYELAMMREAMQEALETDIQIESDVSPERSEFNRIRREQGLKAALAWRDKRK